MSWASNGCSCTVYMGRTTCCINIGHQAGYDGKYFLNSQIFIVEKVHQEFTTLKCLPMHYVVVISNYVIDSSDKNLYVSGVSSHGICT